MKRIPADFNVELTAQLLLASARANRSQRDNAQTNKLAECKNWHFP